MPGCRARHNQGRNPSRLIFWSCIRKRTPRLTLASDRLLRNQPIVTKCTVLCISHIPLMTILESINMLLIVKYSLMCAEPPSKWKLNGLFSVSSPCTGSEVFLQQINTGSKAVVQQGATAARCERFWLLNVLSLRKRLTFAVVLACILE